MGPIVCSGLKREYSGKVACQGVGQPYTAGIADNGTAFESEMSFRPWRTPFTSQDLIPWWPLAVVTSTSGVKGWHRYRYEHLHPTPYSPSSYVLLTGLPNHSQRQRDIKRRN